MAILVVKSVDQQTLRVKQLKTGTFSLVKESVVKIIDTPKRDVLQIGIGGAQGLRGLPGGVNDGSATVLPSENRTIEVAANVLSNSWFLTFYDVINDLIKTCTVRANISGSFTVYGLEGSIMPVKVTVLNGLELKVKNNSASSILVKFQRISIEA